MPSRELPGPVSSVDGLLAMKHKELTKQDVANIADEYGWTPLSRAEVPYYQQREAKAGTLTRWLRVTDPGRSGVVEYMTLYWDGEGRWTGRASCERYKCGASIGTDWVHTIKSLTERFRGGINVEHSGGDAAVLPLQR